MSRWKKVLRWLRNATLIFVLTLLLLEVSYRFQWIDFYSNEWNYQTRDEKRQAERILIFGDSFSADPNGWARALQDSLTKTSVYNASVPGIGTETHVLMFADRVEEVQPTHVILQLYVGNDLLDLQHPVNWSKLGFFRNLFWSISNDFRALGFINYRLAQFAPEQQVQEDSKVFLSFDARTYSSRTRMYIEGDVHYPGSQIFIKSGDARMTELIEHLKWMKQRCPPKCQFSVLLIPHCIQVEAASVKNYQRMGAKITQRTVGFHAWKKYLKDFDLIDPIDVLQDQAERGMPVYYPNDPHLTPEGSRVLMQLVAAKLGVK